MPETHSRGGEVRYEAAAQGGNVVRLLLPT